MSFGSSTVFTHVTNTVVVRYQTRPESADENQRLVEQVFAQLNAEDPGGLRYATFRLADGVSFIHVATVEGQANPLSKSSAFAEFLSGIAARTTEPPVSTNATLVGAYRFVTG